MEKKKKLFVEMDLDVEQILNRYREKNKKKTYNLITNGLIRSFLELNPFVLKVLNEALTNAYDKLQNEISTIQVGSFAEAEWKQQCVQIENIYEFLNDRHISDIVPQKQRFIKPQIINMDNMQLIIPSDWLKVEWANPQEATYAGVIETKNGSRHSAPYFYFLSCKDIHELTAVEQATLLKRCCEVYPPFAKVLELQVAPVKDANGVLVNEEEYFAAPLPCFYSIPHEGTRDEYLFGARIIKGTKYTPTIQTKTKSK